MLDREVNIHEGCPNRHHCSRDESRCCYLLSNRQCYLETDDSEDFL